MHTHQLEEIPQLRAGHIPFNAVPGDARRLHTLQIRSLHHIPWEWRTEGCVDLEAAWTWRLRAAGRLAALLHFSWELPWASAHRASLVCSGSDRHQGEEVTARAMRNLSQSGQFLVKDERYEVTDKNQAHAQIPKSDCQHGKAQKAHGPARAAHPALSTDPV